MKTPSTLAQALRLSMRVSAGLILGGLSCLALAAEPSQSPLSSRSAPPPPPNVMMTIDDSGSMLSDAMPEDSFTLNGKTVGLTNISNVGYWIGGFPNDPRKGGRNAYETGTVPSESNGNKVFQMQYRSPQVNSIWYDTNVRYQPWISTDGVNRMANASPTAAAWDPVYEHGPYDLTATTTKVTTYWCTTSTSCGRDTLSFNPGLYYVLTAGADPTKTASYTAYDINSATLYAPATKAAGRTDCAGTRCTQAEERQNFANWFTYYRMRESLMKAAVSETFASYVGKIRGGWAEINPSNAKLNTSSVVQQGIAPVDAAYLKSLLTNIQNIKSWPSTPLRTAMDQVGAYFQNTTGANNPWLTTVGTANSGFLACRRSINVLMTDGYYNDTYTGAGNVDGQAGPDYAGSNPNGYSPVRYLPGLPYQDSYSNTLADVAMKYYVTDLQSGIDNKVAPVDGDIAFWQHLTQFTIGLGVKGTLDSSSDAAKLATLSAIKAGNQGVSWPDPTKGSPQKIDDLWHAAVNTGGDFYSVRNVTELTAALADAFGRAGGGQAKTAGVAVSSSTAVAGNLKLVPTYHVSSWDGDVLAYTVDASGNGSASPTWSASANVPAWASRNLYTWDGTQPVLFTWPGMGKINQTSIGSGGQNLTDWVRGDASNEGVANAYRSRGSGSKRNLLGDFVDSPPVYVRGLVDLAYDNLDAGYRSYVAQKQARTVGTVFAGANDGMLHAFRSDTGAEVFGYLPQAGLANLSQIADKAYGTPAKYHRFFVDGPVVETDAYIANRRNSTAEWSDIVIGSMGAGGKGVFALHVPTANPTALDGKTLLWELSSSTAADMGYVMSEVAVGKIKGGGWKAFVGNGVDSASGVAALLVVDLATGSVDQQLTVDSAGSNGLMGVTLLKDSTTKEVVGAYAGDLKGNLWRFDFDGATASDWHIGFNGSPLFHAAYSGVNQPITMAPLYVSSAAGPGRVVLFGTGRLITDTDAANTDVQSYYGVLDPTADGASSSTTTSPFASYPDNRTPLQVQTASTTAVTGANGRSYFTVTANTVNWATQQGWYMDLPFSGQRDIYPSLILNGDYVYIQTIVPAGAAADCDIATGTGYNYLLVARSGSEIQQPIFDTNGDGVIDSKDAIVGGFLTTADGVDKPVFKTAGDESEGFMCSTQQNCDQFKLPSTQYTIKDRVWRQLLKPPEAP